jgi:hypothetical protein
MVRSILCGTAAVVFFYAGVTFPEYNAVFIEGDGGAAPRDAATAVASAMQPLLLGLGLLAAGCVDWAWLRERAAGTDRQDR